MYGPGSGLLFVTGDHLFFIDDAEHPARSTLLAAAASDRPMRSLAAAVTDAASAVPPFVFLQQREELEGMAGGSIEVAIAGSETSVIGDHAGASWRRIGGAGTAVVSSGGEVGDSLWIDSGVVQADAFRWEPVPDAAATIVPAAPTDLAADETRLVAPLAAETQLPATAPALPPPATGDLDLVTPGALESLEVDTGAAGPVPAGASLTELLETETDLTIEAIRLAEIRKDSDAEMAGCALTPGHPGASGHRPAEPVTPERARPHDRADDPRAISGVDPQQTIAFGSGEVVLETESRDGTVEALVCASCVRPNPPAATRCRGCNTVLAGGNSEHRLILQPNLGVIHLADGRIEPLDADIVIGRNPAREPLESHQRAVVHGEGNRYVSRRHIELRRDGWAVVVLNLREGRNTTVESRRGGHAPLAVDVAHKLKDGDTVHFGRSWFRYEERL